jgi:hypothetical protein
LEYMLTPEGKKPFNQHNLSALKEIFKS